MKLILQIQIFVNLWCFDKIWKILYIQGIKIANFNPEIVKDVFSKNLH